jgi:hypothetical protein
MTLRRLGGAALAVAGAAVVAQPQTAQAPAAGAGPGVALEAAPKLSPLLGELVGRVTGTPVDRSAGAAPPGLFRRLAKQMQGEPVAAGTAAAAAPAVTPALGYAMEQLDPASFALLRPITVAGAPPLLRTGDVFVLQFSTNLPGQVRLENTDAQGKVADLGTYTVLVDQLNRLPRDKGIQLQGRPGHERLRFYFYPCLPPEAAGKPWFADFHGKLPACGATPALQTAQAKPLGTVAPRALVNLAQPDTTMVFAGASDYQTGEVTVMDAVIRHVAR